MYRVLIVDDEPWVAYGISKLIPWESEGFQVIGEAFDGSSALTLIQEHRPEVVISDIRMPGLNGIQLLEEISNRQLETEVILVSGYSEFEYAQQALRLGAFDYLLKQIEREQLMETIARLKCRLERNRLTAKDPDMLLNELFDLLDADGSTTIGQFHANRGDAFRYPDVRVVNGLFPYATVTEAAGRDTGIAGLECLALRTGLNKQSYIVHYDETAHPDAFGHFLAEDLKDASYIGISPVASSSSSLSKMFQAADIALTSSIFYPERRIMQYAEHETMTGVSGLMLQLELSIKEQKLARTRDYLDQLAAECSSRQWFADQIASVYNRIISLFHKYYGNADAFQEIEFLSYDQLARSFPSIHALFERLKSNFELEVTPDFPIVNEQVKAVMEFVDSRFTEDIMLGTIAKTFNLSLSYLSHLIKKETGTYYSEYIASKRIALAKELLRESSLSVQEVVERVGYRDYFHFNKLFKKHVGLTPSKFRKI